MQNKTFLQIIIVALIFIAQSNHVNSQGKFTDPNTPISYKIELLPWEEVKEIIPNKAKFTIIDVETGLQFNVQRRAGSGHADVQPLTKEDTKIMKEIYNGKWSWDRRAILVLVNDQLIAASMNGMPHGGDGIKNNFPGHFCVHFYGSITHRLKNEDLAHKLMIMKAAGKIDEYLFSADPYEIIKIFSIAVNQKDETLLNLVMADSECSHSIDNRIKNIEFMSVNNFPTTNSKETNGPLMAEVPVKVDLYLEGKGKERSLLQFILKKETFAAPWLIDQCYLEYTLMNNL